MNNLESKVWQIFYDNKALAVVMAFATGIGFDRMISNLDDTKKATNYGFMTAIAAASSIYFYLKK